MSTIATNVRRLEHAVQRRTGFGHATTTSRSTLDEGLRCVSVEDRWTVASDLPVALGGSASAPTPSVLLRAALGACMAMTYRLRAERAGLRPFLVTVDVETDSELAGMLLTSSAAPPGFTGIRYHVDVRCDAPPEAAAMGPTAGMGPRRVVVRALLGRPAPAGDQPPGRDRRSPPGRRGARCRRRHRSGQPAGCGRRRAVRASARDRPVVEDARRARSTRHGTRTLQHRTHVSRCRGPRDRAGVRRGAVLARAHVRPVRDRRRRLVAPRPAPRWTNGRVGVGRSDQVWMGRHLPDRGRPRLAVELRRSAAHAEYLASIERFADGAGYRIPGEFVVASARRDDLPPAFPSQHPSQHPHHN